MVAPIEFGLPSAESLREMRESPKNQPGTRWAVYQDKDCIHEEFGMLLFEAVGPSNTYLHPPPTAPANMQITGWRYQFIGFVDLVTGQIEQADWQEITEQFLKRREKHDGSL